MRNILIVVDMQKDFVTGALASAEAQAILPEVMAKISEYDRAGKKIICRRTRENICRFRIVSKGQMDGRSVQSLLMESLRNIRPLTSRHSGS